LACQIVAAEVNEDNLDATLRGCVIVDQQACYVVVMFRWSLYLVISQDNFGGLGVDGAETHLLHIDEGRQLRNRGKELN
jgi:hypothetical protein